MPVTIAVTAAEADLLEASKVEGVTGDNFTYNPTETSAILAKLPEGEVRDRIVTRLTDVATQLGVPHVLFTHPDASTVAYVSPAHEQDEEPEEYKEDKPAEKKPQQNRK